MFKILFNFLILFIVITFNACGGGSDSFIGDGGGTSSDDHSVSGSVVDNYIKGATVCIDTNKNNYCDSNEITTTTNDNGSFTFSQILNNDDIILSYGGVDTITGESFNYITKNIVSNKDSHGKVILTSINTLIVDYMQETNSSLSVATTAIVGFLGGASENISADMAIGDVIANKSTQIEELEKSLKIFQMIGQINDINDSNSSAKSFQDLAKYIADNNSSKDDDNLTITKDDGSTVDLNNDSYIPVILSIDTDDDYNINYYTNISQSDSFDIEAIDPNGGTITYGIVSGKDSSAFTSTSSGIKFTTTPTYTDPLDDYNSTTQSNYDGVYLVDVNISNGTTYIIKTLEISVIEYDKTIKPILEDRNITIENNSTEYPVDKIIGSIGIVNSGDSAIIKYELDSINSYFDVNRSNGNILVLELPNVTGDEVDEQNLSIRAKNSAGWSNDIIVKIRTVADGELNTTATLENTTFNTVYENNSSTQIVGNVPIANEGGQPIDDYNITSGNDSGYFNINSSGELNATADFDYETTSVYTIGVKAHNGNGWGDEATMTINIQNVNEAPIITHIENNATTINLGETKTLTFDIDDGDSGTNDTDQNMTISISDSNSSIVEITNTPDTSMESSGTLSIDLNASALGTSVFTITVSDDGGTANGGVDTVIYDFNVTIRANGWKLYQNQKDSNYTTDTIEFDGLTYDWNSSAMWYETSDTNESLEKILLPIKIMTDTNNEGANVIKKADGHYYVTKDNYIYADRKAEGSAHDPDNLYDRADGETMKVADRNFQHDPVHHIFVSTIIYDDNGADGKDYYAGWIDESSSNYVDANESNTSYGVAKDSYAGNTVKIDENNDGNDICSRTYGDGWRLPTSYEIGINIDSNDGNNYFGFIPAYVGSSDNDDGLLSSTRYSDTNNWVIGIKSGVSTDLSKDGQISRCVYAIY